MKGSIGLIIAAGLGLVAVALNWVYLNKKTEGTQSVSFIAVGQGVTINAGEYIKESQVVEVQVPRNHAKNLTQSAFLYRNLKSVVGSFRLTRTLHEGDLVLREHYRTSPTELAFPDDEKNWVVMVVPVDSRRSVPSLSDPGDKINFIGTPVGSQAGTQTNLIGPFTIAAMGNRLGSLEAARGTTGSRVRERQISVFVELEGKKFKGEAARLNDEIGRNSGRGLGYVLERRDKQE